MAGQISDPIRLSIGIDDTDNLESRGTGFRARELGARLRAAGLADVLGITRHQLLVDPRIPYTSHNSSLCLEAEAERDRMDEIARFSRDYLLESSAPGSDTGLCIAERVRIAPEVVRFGIRAKQEVLERASAGELAEANGIFLEGLTGDHGGMIGALAAVGLRATGRDGRFVWLPGVRELRGSMSADALYRNTKIDDIRSLAGQRITGEVCIDTDPWPRPVLLEGRAVLLVQKAEQNNETIGWRVVPREIIKRY